MNASTPIDLEQFLWLDDNSRNMYQFQNSVLYTSLTISIMVATLAMAAKLWLVRYNREVTTSGPPRACAKRRQEAYAGLVAWKLLPMPALCSFRSSSHYYYPSLSLFLNKETLRMSRKGT